MPVARALQMLSPSRTDGCGVEQPAFAKPLLRQQFLRPGPQGPPEPSAERNGEARLWPFHQVSRHMAIEHLAQQPFAAPAPDLEVSRQPPGELHDAMIEDRHAHFE